VTGLRQGYESHLARLCVDGPGPGNRRGVRGNGVKPVPWLEPDVGLKVSNDSSTILHSAPNSFRPDTDARRPGRSVCGLDIDTGRGDGRRTSRIPISL